MAKRKRRKYRAIKAAIFLCVVLIITFVVMFFCGEIKWLG